VAGNVIRYELHGLTEVKNALKAIDRDAPKQLREGFLPIMEKVAGRISGKVPHLTGAAAASIKPRASQKGAGIAFGGSKAEYYPWLDFGGSVGRGGSIHRPFSREGRYVYPTIMDSMPEIENDAEELMERLAERHRFEVRGH
jgi:hypothetical protein